MTLQIDLEKLIKALLGIAPSACEPLGKKSDYALAGPSK